MIVLLEVHSSCGHQQICHFMVKFYNVFIRVANSIKSPILQSTLQYLVLLYKGQPFIQKWKVPDIYDDSQTLEWH